MTRYTTCIFAAVIALCACEQVQNPGALANADKSATAVASTNIDATGAFLPLPRVCFGTSRCLMIEARERIELYKEPEKLIVNVEPDQSQVVFLDVGGGPTFMPAVGMCVSERCDGAQHWGFPGADPKLQIAGPGTQTEFSPEPAVLMAKSILERHPALEIILIGDPSKLSENQREQVESFLDAGWNRLGFAEQGSMRLLDSQANKLEVRWGRLSTSQ